MSGLRIIVPQLITTSNHSLVSLNFCPNILKTAMFVIDFRMTRPLLTHGTKTSAFTEYMTARQERSSGDSIWIHTSARRPRWQEHGWRQREVNTAHSNDNLKRVGVTFFFSTVPMNVLWNVFIRLGYVCMIFSFI